MLDPKHKNIGATASMLRLIGQLSPQDDMYKEIASLFILESDDCDYKHKTGACVFNGSLETNLNCCIGECPLGRELDKEDSSSFGADPEDRMQLYGKNTMNFGDRHEMSPEWHQTVGEHLHVGYTGWRKHWHALKSATMEYWKDKMYYLKWAVLVLVVFYGSRLAGHLSVNLW